MPLNPKNCLFNDWQAKSAPMFHTSAFWPAFNEPTIQRFLAGEGDSPVPSRPGNIEAARTTQRQIQRFIHHLESLDPASHPCTGAYLEFERERVATLSLIIEAARPQPNFDRITGLGDQLFGSLTSLRHQAALSQLKAHLDTLEPRSQLAATAQATLLDIWSGHPATATLDPLLSDLNRYRLELRPRVAAKFAFVEELLAPYAGQDTLPSHTVHDLLVDSISRIFAGAADGWTAHLAEGAPNVHIDYDRRAIVIPTGRHFAMPHVRALIIHEAGVHIVRSLMGERSQERLAGYGLTNYGPAEEALGVLMEHAPEPDYQPISALIPLGIIGLAGQLPQPSFRRLHELTQALLIVMANPDTAQAEAKGTSYARAAFSRVMRLSRYGTGRIIDRSTTKYWRGLLVLAGFFAANGSSDTILDDLMRGKYDPQRSDQLRLIKTHSLTPPAGL